MKSIAFAICQYWCVAGLAGLAQTESPNAYAEAASAFQQGKLDPAEQKLRGAIAGEPDRPDLLGLLALVLDAKKEYEQAEPFHQRALDLAPQSAGLWNNFGNHYLARENDAQAGKAFLRVLSIDPVSSAKRKIVVKLPPSPGDTHDASRQAQTSSQHGNRRAACVCGR